MKHPLLMSVMLLLPISGFAQKRCYTYMCSIEETKRAIASGDFSDAFNYLTSAEGYPDSKAEEVNTLRKWLFDELEKQKNKAKNDRDLLAIQKHKSDSLFQLHIKNLAALKENAEILRAIEKKEHIKKEKEDRIKLANLAFEEGRTDLAFRLMQEISDSLNQQDSVYLYNYLDYLTVHREPQTLLYKSDTTGRFVAIQVRSGEDIFVKVYDLSRNKPFDSVLIQSPPLYFSNNDEGIKYDDAFQFSPSGKHIAWLADIQGKPFCEVYSLSTLQRVAGSNEGVQFSDITIKTIRRPLNRIYPETDPIKTYSFKDSYGFSCSGRYVYWLVQATSGKKKEKGVQCRIFDTDSMRYVHLPDILLICSKKEYEEIFNSEYSIRKASYKGSIRMSPSGNHVALLEDVDGDALLRVYSIKNKNFIKFDDSDYIKLSYCDKNRIKLRFARWGYAWFYGTDNYSYINSFKFSPKGDHILLIVRKKFKNTRCKVYRLRDDASASLLLSKRLAKSLKGNDRFTWSIIGYYSYDNSSKFDPNDRLLILLVENEEKRAVCEIYSLYPAPELLLKSEPLKHCIKRKRVFFLDPIFWESYNLSYQFSPEGRYIAFLNTTGDLNPKVKVFDCMRLKTNKAPVGIFDIETRESKDGKKDFNYEDSFSFSPNGSCLMLSDSSGENIHVVKLQNDNLFQADNSIRIISRKNSQKFSSDDSFFSYIFQRSDLPGSAALIRIALDSLAEDTLDCKPNGQYVFCNDGRKIAYIDKSDPDKNNKPVKIFDLYHDHIFPVKDVKSIEKFDFIGSTRYFGYFNEDRQFNIIDLDQSQKSREEKYKFYDSYLPSLESMNQRSNEN